MDIISRRDAKSKGLKCYFTGIPCKHGHISERRVSNCNCVECRQIVHQKQRSSEYKELRKKYDKKYRTKKMQNSTPETRRALYQRYYISNMMVHARKRAKKRNIVFELKKEDINIPEFCPVLGIKIDYDGGKAGMETSPTLDRVDNSKGYTKDNICVISFRANSLKYNSTLQNFERIKGSPDEKQKIIEYMLTHSQKKELDEA